MSDETGGIPSDDTSTPLPEPDDHPDLTDDSSSDWAAGSADAPAVADSGDVPAASGDPDVRSDAEHSGAGDWAAGEPEDAQHADGDAHAVADDVGAQNVVDEVGADVPSDAASDEPFGDDEAAEQEAAADPLGETVSTALAELGDPSAWDAAAPVTGWSGTAVAPEPAVTAWAVPVTDPDPDYVDPSLITP